MHRSVIAFFGLAVFTSASVIACSTTVDNGQSSSGSSGSTSSSGGTSSGGTSSGGTSSGGTDGGSSGNPGEKPPASTSAATVSIGGTCPTFAACAGSPQGTYDYTAGCVADVFAAARQQCPALDSTNATVTVTGSLYFVGNALTRKVTTNISGSIKLPMSCTAGQCAAAETALKSAFDSATCTGTTDCTCTITNAEKVDNATTFTVAGSTVTTGDGETYQICEKPTSFEYSGKSAGSESGVWSMKKR